MNSTLWILRNYKFEEIILFALNSLYCGAVSFLHNPARTLYKTFSSFSCDTIITWRCIQAIENIFELVHLLLAESIRRFVQNKQIVVHICKPLYDFVECKPVGHGDCVKLSGKGRRRLRSY